MRILVLRGSYLSRDERLGRGGGRLSGNDDPINIEQSTKGFESSRGSIPWPVRTRLRRRRHFSMTGGSLSWRNFGEAVIAGRSRRNERRRPVRALPLAAAHQLTVAIECQPAEIV